MNLLTERLELVPFAPQHLLSLIAGTEQFTVAFGRPVAEGLREFFIGGEVSTAWIEQLQELTAPDPWSLGFAICERASGLVIGSCGFKGPPDEYGEVELGYGIAPAFEGRGYATEATLALIEFATQDPRVRMITAHTLRETNASGRVLTKCGFAFAGDVDDPDDGPIWRWERPVTDLSPRPREH